MLRRGMAVVVAAGLVLAACSSSSKKTATTGGTTPATTAAPAVGVKYNTTWDMTGANAALLQAIGTYPTVTGDRTTGVTATTIKVGGVSDETANGQPSGVNNFCSGAKARFDRANAAKELSRTIDFVGCDNTDSNPTTTQTDITKYVSSSNVFAMMANTTSAGATTPLETQHVPYFGGFADCGKNTVFGFSVGASQACTALTSETANKYYTYNDGIMSVYSAYSHTPFSQIHYAALASNEPFLTAYVKGLVNQFKSAGVQVLNVTDTLPANSAQAVDLTPYIQPVLAVKPQVIGMVVLSVPLLIRAIGALRQAGFTGDILAALSDSMMQNPSVAQELDGTLNSSIGWGFPVYGGKYWDEITSDATKVNAPVPITTGFRTGWLSADMFLQGLKDLAKSGKDLTAENLTNFMNANWIWNGFGNVSAPLPFPYGKYGAQPCGALAKMSAAKKGSTQAQDLVCGHVFVKAL